jgi:hypothetical protein
MGMTPERVKEPDALFFLQLVAPICDVEGGKSSIPDDHWKNFFVPHTKWTNKYIHDMYSNNQIGIGHSINNFTVAELVRWWGIVGLDGVLGGTHHRMERRWKLGTVSYNPLIASAMPFSRFQQGKWSIKLCDNKTAHPRGHAQYDPAYKYRFICDVLCDNTNYMTKLMSRNLCMDETTWAFGAFAEAGTNICRRIPNKPGITKGGQTVMVTDVERFRLRAHLPRHRFNVAPPNFGTEAAGPIELYHMLNQLDELNVDRNTNNAIWKCNFNKDWMPLIVFDNFFWDNIQ